MELFYYDQPSFDNLMMNDNFFFDDDEEEEDIDFLSDELLIPNHHHKNLKNSFFGSSLDKQLVLNSLNDQENNFGFNHPTFSPKFNFKEDENQYYIFVNLNGISRNQLRIDINDEDRILTISGKKNYSTVETFNNNSENNTADDNSCYYFEEYTYEKNEGNNEKLSAMKCDQNRFMKSFNIPEDADIKNIKAKMIHHPTTNNQNHTLKITIKKINFHSHHPNHLRNHSRSIYIE